MQFCLDSEKKRKRRKEKGKIKLRKKLHQGIIYYINVLSSEA